jgi:hypothetical protein
MDVDASARLTLAMYRLRRRGVPMQAIADTYNLSRQAVSSRLSRYRKEVLKEGRPPGPPVAADRAILWRQRLDHPDLHCKTYVANFRRRLVSAIRAKLTACHLVQADICARVSPLQGRRHATWLSHVLNGHSDLRLSSLARIVWAMGLDMEITFKPTTDRRASPPGESVPAPSAPHLFAAPVGNAPSAATIVKDIHDELARQNGR